MGTLILEPNWYYPITNTWDAVLHVHGDNLSNAPLRKKPVNDYLRP